MVEERRKSEQSLAEFSWKQMDDHIEKKIEPLRRAIEDNEKAAERRHRELIDMVKSAFPDDDPIGHRKEHEEKKREHEEARKARNEIIVKVVSSAVWTVIVGSAIGFWTWLTKGPK